jgi:GcrA cell cycle regulator
MEWTEELIARLRALWDEGHSTAEIGRGLGISKNAVVGKAHRLNLPARPSPIRREPGAEPPRPRRVARGPTLPPLAPVAAGLSRPPGSPRPALPARFAPAAAVVVDPGQESGAAPRPVRAPRPFARTIACCWPLGEPGTPDFRFCGGDAIPGKPYCVEHAQLAYVRVRERRDDAA